MSLLSKIKSRLTGQSGVQEVHSGRPEDTGGRADASTGDSNSTTGTTPNEEFVGRASGADDEGSLETGAEKRADAEKNGGTGA